jgi:hypothetical protein
LDQASKHFEEMQNSSMQNCTLDTARGLENSILNGTIFLVIILKQDKSRNHESLLALGMR